MSKALARVLGGLTSLGESPSHDYAPVDHLHAVAACQRASWMASLGVDLVRLKLANVGEAYPACRDGLALALMQMGRLKLRGAQAELVATQCLMEWVVDFCATCSGSGQIRDGSKADDRDGIVPMTDCPECRGHGVRRYTDSERSETVGKGRAVEKAIDACHSLISEAVGEAMRGHRKYMRD